MYIYVYICIYLYMYIYILNIITIYQHFCWWTSPLRHHVFTCGVLEPPEMSKSIEGWDPAGELFCGADFLGMGTRWDGNFQGTLTRKEGRIDFLVFQCFSCTMPLRCDATVGDVIVFCADWFQCAAFRVSLKRSCCDQCLAGWDSMGRNQASS